MKKLLFQALGTILVGIVLVPVIFGGENNPPKDFVALFNGKDLTGWKANDVAKAHWVVQDGIIDYDGKDTHLWTEHEFVDFVLMVDWRWTRKPVEMERPVILPNGDTSTDGGKVVRMKVLDAGDSGIYLRGWDKSQVNIWCWPIGSGEVYGYRTDSSQPAEVRAGVTPKKKADKPLGEWNSFVITMKGERLTVVLNGEEVITSARLPGVRPRGPIALQNHGDPIQFRNIYIKELSEK